MSEHANNSSWVGLFVVAGFSQKFIGVGEVIDVSREDLPVGPMLHVKPLTTGEEVVEVLPIHIRVLLPNPYTKPIKWHEIVFPSREHPSTDNIGYVVGWHLDKDRKVVSVKIVNFKTGTAEDNVPFNDVSTLVTDTHGEGGPLILRRE
jgi:hypothetical protein